MRLEGIFRWFNCDAIGTNTIQYAIAHAMESYSLTRTGQTTLTYYGEEIARVYGRVGRRT
jgi:hypothetical protein